jgi:cobalt-zinc-cadmium efflux system membrane fusion protein
MNKIIISIICMASILACKSEKKTQEVTQKPIDNYIVFTKKQFKNLELETAEIEEKIMDISIDANGVVDVPPDQIFSVSYPMNGVISSINHNLLPGKFINKGQLLAEVQSMELLQTQEEYLNETTKYELYSQEYDRQKNLLADDATAKKKFQEIDNVIKLNKIKIKALSEKLKVMGVNSSQLTSSNLSARHAIYASQNGFVKNVYVTNGKSFRSDETLFELIGIQHMHIELKVFGNDMFSVKEGQEVDFVSAEGKNILGKVYLVDKTVDMDKKSLNLHVHLEDEVFEKSLRPGQYISGRINVKNSKVMALPESAILSNSEGKFIFKMMDEKENVKFLKIEVKTGRTAHGFIEIIQPETIQGKIVTKGVSFVENGASNE